MIPNSGGASVRIRTSAHLALALVLVPARLGGAPAAQDSEDVLSRVEQLRDPRFHRPGLSCPVELEGTVWWVSATQQRLVLDDASGTEVLEMAWQGPPPRTGDRVRVTGHGTVRRTRSGYRIGARGAIVDNDGVHALIEKSGTVHLRAGPQPVRLEWFNGVERYGLEIECAGPGWPRQPIPEAWWFRPDRGAAGSRGGRVQGLEFRCYEGAWQTLPDFSRLVPVTTGAVSCPDLGARSRDENVALTFEGFLEAPREGAYTFYLKSDDGSRLLVGEPTLWLEVVGKAGLPAPRRIALGQALGAAETEGWVEVEGRVAQIREREDGAELELVSGAARVRLELPEPLDRRTRALQGGRLRAEGFGQATWDVDAQRTFGVVWVPGGRWIEGWAEPAGSGLVAREGLPLLTTASEVHRLRREEAQRGYPVRLRGVVTSVLPEHQAFTIQDATRGIYVVDISPHRKGPPEIGEYLELEGTTDPSLFAPIVNAGWLRSLGPGHLPEPIRPSWDQLVNGSLDAQYVEVPCILSAAGNDRLTLLTAGGVLSAEVRLRAGDPTDLRRYENALLRVRGCLFALWDYVTHQVRAGEIRIYDADLVVDQPPPADVFAIPAKTTAELRLFDPHAGPFQRVRVSGQVLHTRGSEGFLTDGAQGVRFVTRSPVPLRIGDRVEVVGFPDLWKDPSPVLREAVVRRTGHAPLPGPRRLEAGEHFRADHDATRVRVEGILVGVEGGRAAPVLEMQIGARTFLARWECSDDALPSLRAGSRLELTGTFAGQGRGLPAGGEITAFELLLASPADIRVLARPPWWTLKRLLVTLAMLAGVLAASALWIAQLRRQVDQRTAELGAQIRERQQLEQQRALAQERARIAQDLHDDLGSGITEVSMLAARARSTSAPGEARNRYLDQVGDRAREMVTALDEIVWAMNPRHDSLASLVSYFSLYADRFLGLAGVGWRLDSPAGHPDPVVDSRKRHQLFLAFKEALHNVVRHSQAAEVHIRIQLEQGEIALSITDNGRGLGAGDRTEAMDGVANMRARLERLGGRFELSSEPGRGTALHFRVPTS